jgi:hypothetical protein
MMKFGNGKENRQEYLKYKRHNHIKDIRIHSI